MSKLRWMIVDVHTGAIDEFYSNYEDAKAVYDAAIERCCQSITLCKVFESAPCARISDYTFWCRHDIGYAGDVSPLMLKKRDNFL